MRLHQYRYLESGRIGFPAIFLALAALFLPGVCRADTVKHQITGLCNPDREPDLRAAVARMANVKLLSIDFPHAEATFEYDPDKIFPGVKAEDRLRHFNDLLGTASNHTFGIKPLRTVPLDKLELIDIPVAGLDCKGCCLAAYEMISKLDGVERATASFKEGRITALVDPTKINRAKLEETLKMRGVDLTKPAK